MSDIVKKSDITLSVGLDEKNIPKKITWKADDNPIKEKQDAKAFLLSIWDKKTKDTFKIDLWTDDMTVEEMQFFYFNTLMTMADTWDNSTNLKEDGNAMRQLAIALGKKYKVIK